VIGSSQIAEEFFVIGDAQIIVPDDARISASRKGRRPHLAEIADNLTAAESGNERRTLIQAALSSMGFEWLCYCRLVRTGERVSRAVYFGDYSPEGWPKNYLVQRYADIDPRVSFACQFEWPLVWDLQSLGRETRGDELATRALKRFLEEADRASLRSGVTYGLFDPETREHTVISFASSEQSKSWIVDSIIGQAYAVGIGLHEFMSRHGWPVPAIFSDIKLTEIQKNVLSLLTDGLSDKEIGVQLGISAQNVRHQIGQLRKKLGAQNRVHLAYMAGRNIIR